MTEAKKKRLRERQIELLKMFEGDFYQEKQIGDEWYIKNWNGTSGRWQVSVYSAISYRRYKSFVRNHTVEPEEIKPTIPFKRPTLESVKQMHD